MAKKKIKLKIEGMSCASCAKGIEKSLLDMPGVIEVSVHYATDQAVVLYWEKQVLEKDLVAAVERAGYRATISSFQSFFQVEEKGSRQQFLAFLLAALFSLPLALQMVGMFFGAEGTLPVWMQWFFATVVQFVCGWRFYKSSYYALKAGSANMDVLVALGTSAAYFFSSAVFFLELNQPLYFEASAMIITLILLGKWLESRSKRRASEAIQKLYRMQPKKVQIKKGDHFEEVEIGQVQVGDVLLVRPGENVPVDGVVLEGKAAVDESLLTGESIPVSKREESRVFTATMVVDGSLQIRAEQIGADTVFSAMVKLVDQAQRSKAPIQRFADRVSEVFVPLVGCLSLVTFLGWMIEGALFHEALINAVTVLVIACPCALGLATPTVILVASGRAAEIGMLFKEAVSLEQAEKLQLMFLDKTGTLTEGKPIVKTLVPMGTHKEEELLSSAASLELHSSHPLAKAVIKMARERQLPIESIEDFNNYPGRGVIAKKRRQEFGVGSPAFAKSRGVALDQEVMQQLEDEGLTILVVWNEVEVIGYLGLVDALRKQSRQMVDQLKQMGIEPVMVTGDHQQSAEAIAKELGIEKVHAGMSPHEKIEQVKNAKNSGQIVGMAGDGINDAPALVEADIGFAVDAGSDVAMESADIILMGSDPMGIVRAIDLSRATLRKIRQNLFFAFIYNILGIPLAMMGMLSPVVAALAMAMSSLSVVSNALLFKRSQR